MVVETERRPTAERTLTITLQDGRELSFPDQKWYRPYKDIPAALGKNLATVRVRLSAVIQDDPTIKVTTVRKLELSGQLGELYPKTSSHTFICDQDNFKKLLIIAASKEKRPKKPKANSHSPFRSTTLNAKKPQETHRTRPKEMLNMKDPKQILAINSVIKALSYLANGRLQKEIPNNIKEFLEQVAMGHVRLPRFKDDANEGILKKILNSDSESRLNMFFKVNLEAMLYDLWDVIDINERRSKEEKEIIKICGQLKLRGYDKQRATQEVFTHFRIPITSAPGR